MTFKQDYLLSKFSYWKSHNRNLMAEREFDTITYLLRVFFSFELKKGCSILDLGSGDQFLKDEFEKRKISYSSLDIKDLDFEKDKFIFDDNKFDLVISLAVLEHLKDPNIFLNEILSIKNFKNIKIMPNLRCKSRWWYEGSFKFFKACYLLPFTNNVKFIPKFLKGKSRGMFVIAKKDK